MNVRFALIPDEDSSQRLLALCQELTKGLEAKFRLDHNHRPHATLVGFECDDTEPLRAKLAEFSKGHTTIETIGNKLSTNDLGFVMLGFEAGVAMSQLREAIIAEFRSVLTDADVAKYSGRGSYSSLSVVPGYEPADSFEPIKVTFNAIGLGQTGELGSVKEVLFSAQLS